MKCLGIGGAYWQSNSVFMKRLLGTHPTKVTATFSEELLALANVLAVWCIS